MKDVFALVFISENREFYFTNQDDAKTAFDAVTMMGSICTTVRLEKRSEQTVIDTTVLHSYPEKKKKKIIRDFGIPDSCFDQWKADGTTNIYIQLLDGKYKGWSRSTDRGYVDSYKKDAQLDPTHYRLICYMPDLNVVREYLSQSTDLWSLHWRTIS